MEAKLDDPLNVVTYALYIHVKDMPGIFVKEPDQHEEHAETEANLAQSPDSNFQSADNGRRGTCSHAPNKDDLVFD